MILLAQEAGLLQLQNIDIVIKASLGKIVLGDKMAVKLAVIQLNANPGQPEENRDKAIRFAQQALDQGAEIILFHEEVIVGYTPNLRDLAEPVDGPTTQAFQKLLQDKDSLIIYGLTERDGENYYISAPVVSATGVIANYRKTHLWWDAEGLRHEPTYYSPGNELVVFEYKNYKYGIMICYDGDFPEMTRAYANLDCSAILWMNNRESRGHSEVKDLSYRNSMIIAASCCCGKDEKGNFNSGGSNITYADGSLLAELWKQEGIVIADVNVEEALSMRKSNPWYQGHRPSLYYNEQVNAAGTLTHQ
ncbi:carbon-nitrogen hydrolase family protein [Rubellicoccus peritrichatus]|uniref:Carbon-nitrogen hydrolase family protein n=1 Tax=Rubellicoccus peritrichatus TaxID=3080537 RepID=A0AAQ3LCM5_9BACT|nr:carbon-nitrogen hydrolase family protein [Puniceicoccus sp. CR14]WOO41128.1 carbon-nitrogen hydrolase family protein [Puniceicoccus sp. CR14]